MHGLHVRLRRDSERCCRVPQVVRCDPREPSPLQGPMNHERLSSCTRAERRKPPSGPGTPSPRGPCPGTVRPTDPPERRGTARWGAAGPLEYPARSGRWPPPRCAPTRMCRRSMSRSLTCSPAAAPQRRPVYARTGYRVRGQQMDLSAESCTCRFRRFPGRFTPRAAFVGTRWPAPESSRIDAKTPQALITVVAAFGFRPASGSPAFSGDTTPGRLFSGPDVQSGLPRPEAAPGRGMVLFRVGRGNPGRSASAASVGGWWASRAYRTK